MENTTFYLSYKNYSAKVEYDTDDNIYVGTVQDIDDLICFHETTKNRIQKIFEDCIDDYIEMRKNLLK